MPANDKVGSWLGGATGAPDGNDSDGSDAEPQHRINGQTPGNGDEDDQNEDEESVNGGPDGVKREENVDWETVLPKVRPALEDPSEKRRRAFIGRYLYVSDTSPPASSIGPLLQAILGGLPLLLQVKQIDDTVAILRALVERDDKLEEGAEGKAKLAEKLAKWTGMEVGKAVDPSRSTTIATFTPHLLLILGLITSLNSTRGTEALVTSPIFADLLVNLAYVADAIDSTQKNGKESTKVERARRKAHVRIWRALRLLRTHLGQVLHMLVTKTVPQPAKLAVLIGHVVGVISRLKPRGPRNPSVKLNPDLTPITNEKAGSDGLLAFYSSNVIGSKTALPVHVPRAFGPTLALIVDEAALKEKLLPTAERMLLRSPEVALELTAELIDGANIDISSLLPGKLVTSTLSSSKSSNAETRLKSQTLMRSLCAHCSDTATLEKIVTEILSLPKTGKTASAEHRASLFAMLRDIQPTKGVSSIVVDTLVPLISKEANEAALQQLGAALSVHMGHVVSAGVKLSDTTTTLIVKELCATKLPTRRLLSTALGSAIWALSAGSPATLAPETKKLITAILPSLETNLASASANAPANPTGFLEGHVAAALALGPLADVAGAKKLQEAVKALQIVSPKPSFVLNDKAYTKLTEEGDEVWALRSLEVLVKSWGNKLPNEQIRSATGAAFLHFTLSAKSPAARAAAIRSLPALASSHPRAAHALVRESLTSYLQIQEEQHKVPRIITPEEAAATEAHAQKLGALVEGVFGASPAPSSQAAGETTTNGTDGQEADTVDDIVPTAPSASAEKELLADFAIDMLVLSHHPFLTEGAQTSWINLVVNAGLDASALVVERRERVLMRLWESASAPPAHPKMTQAAYRAVTTLAFVCPALYVPTFMEQIKADLEPKQLDFVGLEERGIWITPADQTYVDVLAPKKDKVEDKNRRDYATEKWEAEVRAAQIAKRAASGGAKLSKADQAAVAAQLAKEAEVRARIAGVQAKLQRGMQVVRALVSSNATQVDKEVGTLAKALLASVFAEGAFLLDESAFQVFLSLTTLASDRLGEYRRLLVSAILRARQAPLVPEDYLEEPVKDLVTRLLHQLQYLSSQMALDAPTLSLVSLLISEVVAKGGIETGDPTSEEAQEQLTLAVNIISENVSEFTDDAYPRHATIKDLVQLIRTYPQLAKDASTALIDLGAALQDVAKPDEITEMIQGTLSRDSNVRNAVLQALQPVDLTELDYSVELWIALHDSDEQNANLATHLWEDNGLDIPETYLAGLVPFLAHDSAAVRTSTASSLSAAAEIYPSQIEPTITACQDLYKERSKLLLPEYDRFGMVILETLDRPDPWESRVAIALAMQKMAPMLATSQVEPIFAFLINEQALGDRHGQVRRAMLDAGIAIIDLHGGECIASLMKTFEDYLAVAKNTSEAEDYIKEAVVILFGRLAGHLDATDPRVPKVVDRLVEALNTPSELVQSAVADCLPPLVSGMGEEVEYLVDKLFSTLTTGAKYAGRRGAAYGLAGVVKGRGLGLLKEYEVMDKLIEAAEDKDKGAFQGRQGAVFAFETLSATLGKVFEPYIISIIPQLLTLFGDANTDVREAVQDAAQVIMSKISGHCVKRILPDLLDALEEKQWRTKKGAIELLGAMAFCAPRQLSLSLPTIIPHLTGVINDSHAQVKSAANTSLKRFGEVLNNPEVKAMQSTLMKALADPTAKTESALKALLKTTFAHYLDAPSLALVMPIIDRGLRQRSSETKRKSVQIVGNMASLTESRDLVPYLQQLMPLVHEVLVDPVPEARATAAKSLGTLVERLGENNFPELVQQLLTTLRSETSGVDRQGAAQGLSEVLSGLGLERLESMLPDIITSTSSPRPYIREGFISLLVYLPATFGHRFAPHLGRVIPPILNGLADDSEYVREASMRAGKMIIANYSNKAIDLLLPELEKGMLDPSWRIRQSSIALTGELLYRVTGISGKVELEEDEVPAHGADQARKVLLEALGAERRDRVLATLYIVRQDSVAIVRQASIHIWKALVQNTPRTTREILGVLMGIIMSLLGSDESVQQETASRTLAELCRKNGERIFAEIVPILQKAISSPDYRSREGACLAFADVMSASNRDMLEDHEDAIISAIRKALVDDVASVRAAAAQTFDTAQHYMGAKAVDQTIPTLLEAMREPGEASETALQALQEVMSVRANSVFPVLIPTLIVQPITAFNARALGALVRVAGSALNRRLDTILGALVKSLEKEQSEDIKGDIQGAIESLLASVVDSDGVHQLEMLLIGWAKDHNAARRATGCRTFATLCQVSQADTSEYRVDWIRILVSLFDDRVPEVVDAAWESLEHFVKTIDKDELEDLVVPLRRAIEGTGAPGQQVPGFSRPKGAQSVVPILLAGVLSGTQEQREQAALGIGELVQRTSEAAIKPYIIQLTGPLIRVISGQGLAPQIKSAILQTLTVLLEEVPLLVRPFHPQLTRTFVKSASDPAAQSVRARAAVGLGELMKHQPRVDPLITELVGNIRSAEKDVAPSVVAALAAVCSSAGKNIGAPAKASIVDLVEEAFAEPRGETYSAAMGKVVAGLSKHEAEDVRGIVDSFLTTPLPPTQMSSLTILAMMEEAPGALYNLDVVDEIIDKTRASISSDQSSVARPARSVRDLMKGTDQWRDDARVQAAFK